MVSRTVEVARPALVCVRLDIGRGNPGADAQGRYSPGRERFGTGAPETFRGQRDVLDDESGNGDTADDGAAGSVQVHYAFCQSESRPADTRRLGARGRVGVPVQELRT